MPAAAGRGEALGLRTRDELGCRAMAKRASDVQSDTGERSPRATLTVAAVQATPAYLDRAGTLDIVIDEIVKAAAGGADLVVFPESFVPGYPDWVWRRPPMSDGDWYARFS